MSKNGLRMVVHLNFDITHLSAPSTVIVKTSWTFVSLCSLVSVTMQSKQLVSRVRGGPEVPQWRAIIQSQDYQHWRHGDTGAHIDGIMETCGELGSVFRLGDSVGCVTATHL